MLPLFFPSVTEITSTCLLILSTDPISLYEHSLLVYEQSKSGCRLRSYGEESYGLAEFFQNAA